MQYIVEHFINFCNFFGRILMELIFCSRDTDNMGPFIWYVSIISYNPFAETRFPDWLLMFVSQNDKFFTRLFVESTQKVLLRDLLKCSFCSVFVKGTFQAEKEEKVVYGLVHPLESWNPVYIQVILYFYAFYFND